MTATHKQHKDKYDTSETNKLKCGSCEHMQAGQTDQFRSQVLKTHSGYQVQQ
jgi:hypothetical protein